MPISRFALFIISRNVKEITAQIISNNTGFRKSSTIQDRNKLPVQRNRVIKTSNKNGSRIQSWVLNHALHMGDHTDSKSTVQTVVHRTRLRIWAKPECPYGLNPNNWMGSVQHRYFGPNIVGQAHTFRFGLTQEQAHRAGEMGWAVVGRAERSTCWVAQNRAHGSCRRVSRPDPFWGSTGRSLKAPSQLQAKTTMQAR